MFLVRPCFEISKMQIWFGLKTFFNRLQLGLH